MRVRDGRQVVWMSPIVSGQTEGDIAQRGWCASWASPGIVEMGQCWEVVGGQALQDGRAPPAHRPPLPRVPPTPTHSPVAVPTFHSPHSLSVSRAPGLSPSLVLCLPSSRARVGVCSRAAMRSAAVHAGEPTESAAVSRMGSSVGKERHACGAICHRYAVQADAGHAGQAGMPSSRGRGGGSGRTAGSGGCADPWSG